MVPDNNSIGGSNLEGADPVMPENKSPIDDCKVVEVARFLDDMYVCVFVLTNAEEMPQPRAIQVMESNFILFLELCGG